MGPTASAQLGGGFGEGSGREDEKAPGVVAAGEIRDGLDGVLAVDDACSRLGNLCAPIIMVSVSSWCRDHDVRVDFPPVTRRRRLLFGGA